MAELKNVIVFVDLPEKVDLFPELAHEIGKEKVSYIQFYLIRHMKKTLKQVKANIFVFYSHHCEEDLFESAYPSFVQEGDTIAEKIINAFMLVASYNQESTVLVRSDLHLINEVHINKALSSFPFCDLVIGPLSNDTHYLIGLKDMYLSLFKKNDQYVNKMRASLRAAKQNGLAFLLIEELDPISTIDDINEFKHQII